MSNQNNNNNQNNNRNEGGGQNNRPNNNHNNNHQNNRNNQNNTQQQRPSQLNNLYKLDEGSQDLLRTAVDAPAIGCTFALGERAVQDALHAIFAQAGFDLRGIRYEQYSRKDGSNNVVKEASMHAFFSTDDENVSNQKSSVGKLNQFLAERLPGSEIKLSEKLNQVLSIFGPSNVRVRQQQHLVIVQLDIFRVFGLLLGYDDNTHTITIPSMSTVDKELVFIVVKSIDRRNRSQHSGKRDKLSSLL